MRKIAKKFSIAFNSLLETFFMSLPNAFTKFRVFYLRRKGFNISKTCSIARNVYIQGKITIGQGTAIANNCLFNGSSTGIIIGEDVMIAPNCVFVAFNHGYSLTSISMIKQKWEEEVVVIEDDVWVGANCTIGKGVQLGKGCIVGANSFVNKSFEPYSIIGGVPARLIGTRQKSSKE